jgi:ankyrin repeat protein
MAAAPLVEAAKRGDLPEVRRLLQEGADVNQRGQYGVTALSEAAYKGHLPVVQELLTVPGIDINVRDDDGDYTITRVADVYGRAEHPNPVYLDIIQALIDAGCDVNVRDGNNTSALSHACYRENYDLVLMLLAVDDIDVNIRDVDEDTPIMIAARLNDIDIVEALIATGQVDINAVNDMGSTALSLTTSHGVGEALIDAGALDNGNAHSTNSNSNRNANILKGKVNQGPIDIPADKRTNAIDLDDIRDGEEVVRILENNTVFFYRLENWTNWMNRKIEDGDPIINPLTREIVTAEHIDIFTARVPAEGGRRKTTRKKRKAKKTRKVRRR